MTRLVVAEKPSMGRAIAAALGLPGNGRSFIRGRAGGQELIVTWCVGHLVECLEPEGYDPALKRWTLDALPFFPETFRHVPIASSREQYDTVAQFLKREEVTEVVNATDAGREGELIFDLVYRLAGCARPVLRFWTSSLTDDAIREAWAAMKPGEAYAGLRDAARCRQEADWLVGINGTRAQTLVARRSGGEGVYSVGRVQTPTLALLVNRELEIRNFVPKAFWTLLADFDGGGTYTGKWFRKEEDRENDRFETEEEARELAARLEGQPAKVASVSSKTEKKKPELLYDLTALQKEANKRFGFTAEHTLEVAQGLYESKLISYPRTNSRHLTEADARKAPQWLKAIAQGQFEELKPFVEQLRARWPLKLDKRFVNDKEVEDHSALVPTENPAQRLQGDAAKVYLLIARRFLGAWFPDRVEAKTVVITVIAAETFKTTGTVLKEAGWSEVDPPHSRKKEAKPKAAKASGDKPEATAPDPGDPAAEGREAEEPEEAEEAAQLPPLKKGQAVETRALRPKAGRTTPPKRMSEADLLSAMQGAGRELDDEALRGAMKDCGLGTPATRANIIETLLKRGYVERKRNILSPSDKGIEVVRSLSVETLKSPQLTGEWEARLERMRRGEDQRSAFMDDIAAFVRELVGTIRGSAAGAPARRTFGPRVGDCPACGSGLRLRDWEGRHYVRCDGERDPECRVSYDCDAEGRPLETCRFCGGPLRRARSGEARCVACRRDPEEPQAPACGSCGRPMRVIPSTRKGQYFFRCADCGVTRPAGVPPAEAPETASS